MRINHNIMAMNTHRQLGINNAGGAKSLEKLSSGFRINRAGDDAAGLAISEKMRGQIRGLNQASRNAQDGISLIQTAEGALGEVHAMLQRMRELAVQANNGTNTNDDLIELQKEFDQLNSEIDRIAGKTEFNTKKLLDGSLGVRAADGTYAIADLAAAGITADVSGVKTGETLTFTIAADSITVEGTNSGIAQTISVADTTAIAAGTTLNFDAIGLTLTFAADADLSATGLALDAQTITTTGDELNFQIGANQATVLGISIGAMDKANLGTGTAVSGDVANIGAVNITAAGAGFDKNIVVIDKAIAQVSAQRSQLGAYQNRLEYTINNLGTSAENLQAAESRIRDVDMAAEMMEFTKNNILTQAATAMLAQANMLPQSVLQLLG
ncbi:MAG: Flagellin protein FlaA [Firmicutes bacterium]|nr:Flagellin protein FlaA [Bacillota bacterium]